MSTSTLARKPVSLAFLHLDMAALQKAVVQLDEIVISLRWLHMPRIYKFRNFPSPKINAYKAPLTAQHRGQQLP